MNNSINRINPKEDSVNKNVPILDDLETNFIKKHQNKAWKHTVFPCFGYKIVLKYITGIYLLLRL